jgi:molybdenum cofactor synthesis domain-containing protein
MNVELLVTGDEIVRGSVVDTNSAWLLQRLGPLGARVRRITAVGDVADDLIAAMREGASRADVLLVSGGLGPTSDDLTAECAAKVAGVSLTQDAGVRRGFRKARRSSPMQKARRPAFNCASGARSASSSPASRVSSSTCARRICCPGWRHARPARW